MKNNDYCKCEDVHGMYTVNGEFGYQEMCSYCDKPREDGFNYYDSDDVDLY